MKLDNTNYKHNNKRKTESQCAGHCHLGVLLTKIIDLITESKRKKKEGQRKNAVLRRRRNSGKEQNSKKNQNSGKASALCIDGPDGGVLFQPHLDAGAVLASFYD